MKYEVIDNFLDKEYFDSLKKLFADKEDPELSDIPPSLPVGWEFVPDTVPDIAVTDNDKKILTEDKFFYMAHLVYDMHVPLSNTYNNLIPFI